MARPPDVVQAGGCKAFLAWCVDIQLTNFGQAVNDYSIGTSGAVGQAKLEMIGRLATQALSSALTSETSGAFQLAAWELVNENSGLYNLTGRDFKVADSGTANKARTLAQTWFNNLPSVSMYSVHLYVSPTHQDHALFEKSAEVPEPASLALLGMGMVGLMAARCKSGSAWGGPRSDRAQCLSILSNFLMLNLIGADLLKPDRSSIFRAAKALVSPSAIHKQR